MGSTNDECESLSSREERDSTMAQLQAKTADLEKSEVSLAEMASQYAKALDDLQQAQDQQKTQEEREKTLKEQMTKLTDDGENQQKLIAKVSQRRLELMSLIM